MSRKILEPIQIKSMKIKNRIGFAPFLGTPHGPECEVNDNTMNWTVERAKGGVGFALMGGINILPELYELFLTQPVPGFPVPLTIHDDSYISGYRKLTDAAHSYEMAIGAQLSAGGVQKGSSPSPFGKKNILEVIYGFDMPSEEYTIEELDRIKQECVKSAVRSKAAGFDFVELHTAHGYVSLWGGFMSPFTNRRTDKYGGSWENRLRFPAETIEAIRQAVGEDYPIVIRISADELLGADGVTLEDTLKYTVPILEEAGVDCFDITMGSQLHGPNNLPTLYVPRGHYLYMPAAVKKVAKVPVIGVGRILEMEMAEKYLEQGYADLIYLGRQLVADPETPKKYFEGRPEDIRKCIGDMPVYIDCDQCCTVNPTPPVMTATDDVEASQSPKSVLVIGGGVGGLEAARIAALRGHKVTLIEKEGKLGGTVEALSHNPLNEEFYNLIDFLISQMKRLKVDVRICQPATVDDVKSINPDVVIVATGSTMNIPNEIRGKFGVMSHVEALKNENKVGEKVVIQGLGYGAELAIALAEAGKEVTLFGKGREVASNLSLLRRFAVLKRLRLIDAFSADGDIHETNANNPEVITGSTLKDVTPSEIVIVNGDGSETNLPYDTFIVSMGRKSNDDLFHELKDVVLQTYCIGDAKKIGEIRDAMISAREIANKI